MLCKVNVAPSLGGDVQTVQCVGHQITEKILIAQSHRVTQTILNRVWPLQDSAALLVSVQQIAAESLNDACCY
jgi:hypothetical protein